MEITHEQIFNFDGNYIPSHHTPKEEGFYMTIRCGLNGIYTHLDEWKGGHWQVRILDDSKVIAYSKEQITKEQVKEWCDIKKQARKK